MPNLFKDTLQMQKVAATKPVLLTMAIPGLVSADVVVMAFTAESGADFSLEIPLDSQGRLLVSVFGQGYRSLSITGIVDAGCASFKGGTPIKALVEQASKGVVEGTLTVLQGPVYTGLVRNIKISNSGAAGGQLPPALLMINVDMLVRVV